MGRRCGHQGERTEDQRKLAVPILSILAGHKRQPARPRADKEIQGCLPNTGGKRLKKGSEVQENTGGLSCKGSVSQRKGEATGSRGSGGGGAGRGGAGRGGRGGMGERRGTPAAQPRRRCGPAGARRGAQERALGRACRPLSKRLINNPIS